MSAAASFSIILAAARIANCTLGVSSLRLSILRCKTSWMLIDSIIAGGLIAAVYGPGATSAIQVPGATSAIQVMNIGAAAPAIIGALAAEPRVQAEKTCKFDGSSPLGDRVR
jgi:hypothetical protein